MTDDGRWTTDDGRRTDHGRWTMDHGRRTDDGRRSMVHGLWSIVYRPSSILYPALILLFGFVVIAPLLQPGYFWGAHDARHDVYFIFQYDKSVQDGIWFPRWSPDWTFGYGYPFFIVYGPLATFVGELLHHFLGLGYEASVKAVLALSILASGLAMYGFVRSWLGRNAGLVAAVAYMTIPYHLVDVYVRAALAESVALVFLPLALWGFRETIHRPRQAAILGAGAAYAAIMWTSNLVAMVFTPGLVAYVGALLVWQVRDGRSRTAFRSRGSPVERKIAQHPRGTKEAAPQNPQPAVSNVCHSERVNGSTCIVANRQRRISFTMLAPALAFALGLGLSAAFFLPALVEQGYINRTQWFGQYYDPAQHFVYLYQLFDPSWGFGISQPGPDDAAKGAMSFQLGAAATLLTLVALAVVRRLRREDRREAAFWALWALVSVFLTLNLSAWAWRHVPLVPYAQFPWRYLMLALIPLSILPATLVADGRRRIAYSLWRIANGRRHIADGEWHIAISHTPSAICHKPYAIRHTPYAISFLLAALLLLSSAPYFRVEMREPTKEQGPASYAALMRFQRTSDEMTGVTAWVDPQQRPYWSDMAELWVQGKEVTTRVDYGQVPQNRTLAVNSEDVGSAHEQVYWYAEGPGQSITFNRFWYPGWTAYLLDGKNGRPVRELPVEREEGPLARLRVPVPAGEGYILLRFEDTPLRAAAKWITLVTVGIVIGMLARRLLHRVRFRTKSW